ncbi:MAG: malonyl-ACP O-methyltransferase BioC [Betaproteobacteria bacterium]|nr:malonyl-ACP O-methyltransferase BioC [Betaproteobacteria bacterium]
MSALPLPAKREVRQSFGASATTYDEHAFLQREIGDRLFERLQYIKLIPERVLDIGSGTGYATQKLRERFPESSLIALDIAPDMLGYARDKATSTSLLKRLFGKQHDRDYVCADAEALPLASESIDLALSNLAMQWTDPERVAKEAVRVLKPQGLFMFTTFGPDTLKELRAAFKAIDDAPHVNTFPDMHDIGDILVHAGFADPVMDQETITLTYDELKPLLRELKGIGAHNVMPGRATGLMGRQRWQRMVDAYERFRKDGRLPATYEVVYGHAWKPEFGKRKTIDGQQQIDLAEFKRMVMKS